MAIPMGTPKSYRYRRTYKDDRQGLHRHIVVVYEGQQHNRDGDEDRHRARTRRVPGNRNQKWDHDEPRRRFKQPKCAIQHPAQRLCDRVQNSF